jgi:hypothetical protein
MLPLINDMYYEDVLEMLHARIIVPKLPRVGESCKIGSATQTQLK